MAGVRSDARGDAGVSGDPTAGLVPGVPRALRSAPAEAGRYRFGDGLAIGPDLEGAAEVAMAQALDSLDGAPPDLVCVFVAAGVPARSGAVEAAARRVMDASSAATTIGATAAGVFGRGRGVEHGPAIAVWAASLPGARIRPFRLEARSELLPLEKLAPECRDDDRAAALLVDPHTFPVAGFLPHTGTLPVVGGLASARGGPGSNRLFLDGEVHAHGAVGLLLGGDVRATAVVSQGCRPIGPSMTVTRAERNVLLELAGAPALQRLAEVVDALPVPRRRAAARALQLGVVVDEYADEHTRGDFLVRGILGADEATGAVAVGDVVEVGRTVRFHVRDAGSVTEDLDALLPPTGGGARGALLFSCSARGRTLFKRPDHDVRAVRDRFGGAAVAGLVAAGEIGPVGGRNHLHGRSASVLAFG
jgi:small ligand-binding sensory domain FIST